MKPVFEKVNYEDNSLIKGFGSFVPVLSSPLHVHPELELVYIERSFGTRCIGESIEDFREGDLVLVGSNVPHYWKNNIFFNENSPSNSCKALVIQFPDDIFSEKLLSKSEFKNIMIVLSLAKYGIHLYGNNKSLIPRLMNNILKTKGIKKLIYLFEILDIIGRTEELRLLNSSVLSENSLNLKDSKFRELSKYLIDNYSNQINLNYVSNLVNMNKSAFCRYFKKQTGQTFVHFVNELRLRYACKLLQEDSHAVSQICYEVGFNNLSNFNRQFKQLFGRTPREYSKEFTSR